jgi:hypothetical protein
VRHFTQVISPKVRGQQYCSLRSRSNVSLRFFLFFSILEVFLVYALREFAAVVNALCHCNLRFTDREHSLDTAAQHFSTSSVSCWFLKTQRRSLISDCDFFATLLQYTFYGTQTHTQNNDLAAGDLLTSCPVPQKARPFGRNTSPYDGPLIKPTVEHQGRLITCCD